MAKATAIDGFSLTNCGPVDRALARAGLRSGELPRLLLRAFLPALVVWVPLAILAWLSPPEGQEPAVGFQQDLSTHVRFLLFVPLLVLIEASIGRRTRLVALQFVHAELVAAPGRPRYHAALRNCARAIDSTLAELVIAALAVAFVVGAVREFEADGILYWYESIGDDGVELSSAGRWYAVGSVLPPFLLLRWVWRYLAWTWFLVRVSRLELDLDATHPDRAGGLEFVGFGHAAFAGLALAVSCLVAGALGTRVLYEGVSILEYQWAFAVFVILVVLFGIAPLTAFWKALRQAREAGLAGYGIFASRYVQEFQRRWIGTEAGQSPLEASGDVQGLADIGGSFERVYAMRLMPISLRTTLTFALAAALPMFPLVLAVMPLKDLLKILMQAMI